MHFDVDMLRLSDLRAGVCTKLGRLHNKAHFNAERGTVQWTICYLWLCEPYMALQMMMMMLRMCI